MSRASTAMCRSVVTSASSANTVGARTPRASSCPPGTCGPARFALMERAAAAGLVVVGAAHVAPCPVRTRRRRARGRHRRGHLDRRVPPGSSARRTPLVGHHQRQRQAPVGRRPWRDGWQPHVEPVRRDRPRRDPGPGVDVVVDNVGTLTFERLTVPGSRRPPRHQRLHDGPDGRRASPDGLLASARGDRFDHERPQEFADALQLVGSGAVEVPIDATFGFEEFPPRSNASTQGVSSARSCSRADGSRAISVERRRRPRGAGACPKARRHHAAAAATRRFEEQSPHRSERRDSASPCHPSSSPPHVDHVRNAPSTNTSDPVPMSIHPATRRAIIRRYTRGTGTSPAPLGVTPRVTRTTSPGHDRSMQTARPDPRGGHER